MHLVPTPRRSFFSLGSIVPFLLALALVADLTMRFMPMEWFTFRALEAARRGSAPNAPYQANRQFFYPAIYGDLAALGNLPADRVYRPETFTTDKLGYRNPPELAEQGGVDAILIGSSFARGAGVSDEDMPSAAISRATGRRVYNAADDLTAYASVDRIKALAGELRMNGGWVIVEQPDRFDVPQVADRHDDQCTRALGRIGLRSYCAPVSWYIYQSALKVEAQKAVRALEDDRVLPNRLAANVVQRELPDGSPVLLDPVDLERANSYHSEAGSVAFYAQLRRELAAMNLKLLVVLVPNKHTVYGDLLKQVGDPPPNTDFLARLQAGLAGEQIPVVNLTDRFRAAAAAGLPNKQYVFWLDDDHWSPEGIRLGADAVNAVWRPLLGR